MAIIDGTDFAEMEDQVGWGVFDDWWLGFNGVTPFFPIDWEYAALVSGEREVFVKSG